MIFGTFCRSNCRLIVGPVDARLWVHLEACPTIMTQDSQDCEHIPLNVNCGHLLFPWRDCLCQIARHPGWPGWWCGNLVIESSSRVFSNYPIRLFLGYTCDHTSLFRCVNPHTECDERTQIERDAESRCTHSPHISRNRRTRYLSLECAHSFLARTGSSISNRTT
jgi:hypothetical protein